MVDGFTESRGIGGDFPQMRESDLKLASESSNLYVSLKYLNPPGIFFLLEDGLRWVLHHWNTSFTHPSRWLKLGSQGFQVSEANYSWVLEKWWLFQPTMTGLLENYMSFFWMKKNGYKSLGCISSSLLRHLLYCSSRLWFQTLFPYNTCLDVHGS